MRRSSPVQTWLDSMPPATELDTNNHEEAVEIKSEESKIEETSTASTVIEPNDYTLTETIPEIKEENLKVPSIRETWKRQSLESGVLTAAPKSGKGKNKLQRDFSVQSEGYSPKIKNPLFRDHSLQSDASGSSGSSVLNVLGARRVDAESVLLALGFGPTEKQQKLQRIPDRFLVPSKLKGISTEKFIKDEQHSMRMHDCGVFGYRGLTAHCTAVCRFMRPMTPRASAPAPRPPLIDVQESPCTAVDDCS